MSCPSCLIVFTQAYAHPTIGAVCPICLRPLSRKPPRVKRFATHVLRRANALAVAERDGWICQLCLEPVTPSGPVMHRASVDHIVRRRDGGTRDMANLRLAHQSCNSFREGHNVVPFAPPKRL